MAAQQEQSAARSTGKVSWFSDGKGYGFITPDDDGEELFVHQSSIISDGFRSLMEGESVEFTVAQGNDGKAKAVDVTGPGGAPLNKKDNGSRGNAGRRGAGGSGCYLCGESGHLARDCSNDGGQNNSRSGEGCYNCGEAGHFARECRQNAGGRSGGGACYNCGGYGHMARNCPSGRSNGGDRRRSGGDSKCFNCGKEGHFARECPVVAAA